MITRIEIDGFKSFQNFAVDLKPFQVIVGANNVGKSNLFDALRLLADFMRYETVAQAMQNNRGDIPALFFKAADGRRAEVMRFGIELLIEPAIADKSGQTDDDLWTRLRYELHIARRDDRGLPTIRVEEERLTRIAEAQDRLYHPKYQAIRQRLMAWVNRPSTAVQRPNVITTDDSSIVLHADGHYGQERHFARQSVERPILADIEGVTFPTAYAVKQELLRWLHIQLDVAALHRPASVYTSSGRLNADGSNLAAVMMRLSREDPYFLSDVSRVLGHRVANVLDVTVEMENEEFTIHFRSADGLVSTAQIVSDGTLRLLALIVLAHEEHPPSLIMIEEPENGLSPKLLTSSMNLLRGMATAPDDAEQYMGSRLRQVFVNSHSPALVSRGGEDVLFAYSGGTVNRPTRIVDVLHPAEADVPWALGLRRYTWHEVNQLLAGGEIDETFLSALQEDSD